MLGDCRIKRGGKMLIYILHSNKIDTFRLPAEVSGNYVLTDYDADNHIRNLVNISAEDGKWYINSNDDITINYNGKMIPKAPLQEYNFYTLRLFKKENIILYICPGYDKNITIKSTINNSKLLLGNAHDCDIIYTSPSISPKQLELSYINGKWSFANLNNKIPIYRNKKNTNSGFLDNFDVLFIMGLKIVVMGDKILFSCPLKQLNFMTNKLSAEIRKYNTGEIAIDENIKDFYNANDYFLKSPVFRKIYN